MGEIVREIEGSWEDIRAQEADLKGKRVRIQVLRESTVDTAPELRALLKATQRQASPETDEEIDREVEAVRTARQCAS